VNRLGPLAAKANENAASSRFQLSVALPTSSRSPAKLDRPSGRNDHPSVTASARSGAAHYNALMPPLATGLLVDVLGFFAGAVLYVMLVALVWREQAAAGRGSQRGRLPLLTGLCGLVWNLGALLTLGIGALGLGRPEPLVVATSFGALGLLPAVVVHSLFEGRERAAGRTVTQVTVSAA
jgi:hypothetical protein